MAKNDSKTRAFSTTAKPQAKKKSHKSKKRARQQIVISIFAVIALILVVFATLIIGKIITVKKGNTPPKTPHSVYTIPRTPEDIKKGNLLFIDNVNNKYNFSYQPQLINIDKFKKENQQLTTITIDETSYPTYSLNQTSIVLEENTLIAFNKLMMDYCSENISSNDIFNSYSASGIQIAWGAYESKEEYEKDLNGKINGISSMDYLDHALGTTLTLRKAPPHSNEVLNHSLLNQEYAWIRDNAHKYGFIIRYPNDCQNHTGFNSNARIHLRYIGVEHATYIHEYGCCLEEYLKLIRENHGSNNPLEFTAEGKTYNIYYVASSGNPTSIPVPEDKTYYISGDNMNGFIVTVVK